MRAIFEGQIVPLRQRAPDVPDRVAEVIERALTKDPAYRWQTAAAMRTALTHAAEAVGDDLSWLTLDRNYVYVGWGDARTGSINAFYARIPLRDYKK